VRVTNDQLKVLEESDFLFHSEDPRALVITAPRGRGKSFVTGLLVGELTQGQRGL
jgi:Predicted P-loop ATPase fused to an acetyltransferase